mmetsp:Transcript_85545/g.205031  ORF Transcript_85545/g.205031 Transcript_85545/m.205031 type:complete len:193 (+) Transcript_85545:1552-2130(+)
MHWPINLRHNRHASNTCEFDELTDIMTRVCQWSPVVVTVSKVSCNLRVAIHFERPRSRVGKMQVQHIQFELCKHTDQLFDPRNGIPLPRDVQQEAPVHVGWSILDFMWAARYRDTNPFIRYFDCQELIQSRHSIGKPPWSMSVDPYAMRTDKEAITLIPLTDWLPRLPALPKFNRVMEAYFEGLPKLHRCFN